MQHLTPEVLARLVDEAPDPSEARHLEHCAACRAELSEMRTQTAALAELGELEPPAAAWEGIEARLAAEGLVRKGDGVFPGRDAHGRGRQSWMLPLRRMAAALVLFVAGGVAGAAVVRGNAPPLVVGEASGERGATPTEPATPHSADEAARSLREAEAAYLVALTRYAELTGTLQPTDAATRLAALEGIVLTTRAALDEAPADPVINGYHLAATGQRDAMLRQIARKTQEHWF